MGLFRLLFSISVISVHAGPILGSNLVGGNIAVETFFMISGFYMSLILADKYKKGKKAYRLFITNRLLRIYPTYFIIAIITIAVSLYWAHIGFDNRLVMYFQYFGKMDFFSKIYIVFINTFVFGQDTIMFLGLNVHTGALFFAKNFAETVPQIWVMLLVPQGWTLGLEFAFYLLAPFITRLKTQYLIGLIILSFGLRICLSISGLNSNPWSLRFFPTELVFFLLGCVAYKIYAHVKNKEFNERFLKIIYVSLVTLSVFFLFIPAYTIGWFDIGQWIYYIIFFAFMPFMFLMTKNSTWDRNLGKLSYPMYISHSIIIFAMMVYNFGHYKNNYFFGLISVIITLLISILLVKFIEDPIDKYRQQRILIAKNRIK